VGLKIRTGVIGSIAMPRFDGDLLSLEEMQFGLAQSVLADAGLTIDDIDGIVVAANDQYDGRAISIMAASGSVGGVDRDILSTPSASEHALVLGALRVASGLYRTQLVMAWSPTGADSLSEVQRLAADPYFHRRLSLDELASHALQASAIEARLDRARSLAEQIAAKNRRHGLQARPELALGNGLDARRPSLRGPLPDGVAGPTTSGAVALILASADFIRERGLQSVAWLRGMGWATEPSYLGDRDLAAAPALDAATAQAYGDAGIEEPAAEIDLAEVAGATAYQELMAYEGLRFCRRGELAERIADGSFARGGALPVNLSGGALLANPVFCAGMISIAELANQLRGRAGHHQIAGARLGVAHAASGFAMQYQTVIVLNSDRGVEA
jgi:acetyl-CoA C-acetyltransferase